MNTRQMGLVGLFFAASTSGSFGQYDGGGGPGYTNRRMPFSAPYLHPNRPGHVPSNATRREPSNPTRGGVSFSYEFDLAVPNSVAITPEMAPFPGGIGYSTPPEPPRPYVEPTEAERRVAEQIREEKRRQSLELAAKGLAFYNRGLFLSAAAEYGWAIDRDPTNAKLYYCRGIMFNRLGRYDDAILDLLSAVQIDPNFKDAQTALDFAMAQQAILSKTAQ